LCNRSSAISTDPADYLINGNHNQEKLRKSYERESMVFDMGMDDMNEMPFECEK